MKSRILKFPLITALFLCAPVSAQAACDDPSINAAATPSISTIDTPVTYSYDFCHNTPGQRYTVQVFQVTPEGDIARTTAKSVTLSGQPGASKGGDTFTATAAGRYRVLVQYFRVGQEQWETQGEVVFKVNASPAQTPAPAPTQVRDQEVIDQPASPVAQTEQRAVMILTKKAKKRSVKSGQSASFTIALKNTSQTALRGAKVCDRIPSKTQYVSSSKKVVFSGASACVTVGGLAPGKKFSFTIKLRIDNGVSGKVTNKAKATADNADPVKASDYVNVPKSKISRIAAAVTG